MLKKLFCRHDWEPIEKRESAYHCDFVSYSDIGRWTDVLYKCNKCGKRKIRTFAPYTEERKWKDLTEGEKKVYRRL